ncbi:MAG: GtrA family protein [Alphaproteobacteria bacterium]|nr:GtrA family protein [Alphaproteobacteria bacterium]
MIDKETVVRMFKFGSIGVIGFCVDYGVLKFGIHILNLDPYTARLISYICAATTTWFGNRILTFADRPKTPLAKQWASFLALNAVGFVVNYSVYVLLITQFPFIYANPGWAVAAGSLAGMCINYMSSTRLVFPKT